MFVAIEASSLVERGERERWQEEYPSLHEIVQA